MAKRRRSREFKDNRVIDIETARAERRERRRLAAESRLEKKLPRHKPSQRHIIRSLRRRLIYGTIIIAIGIIIGAAVYNIISLKAEQADAMKKLSSLEAEKKALEEELSIVDSKEYIEQQAREQLKMILPGETLYVLRAKEHEWDETEDQ